MHTLKLEKILDMAKWQKLQDSLAEVAGLAIITVDFKGVPITEHSGRRDFCTYMRNHDEMCGFCQKCDSRGGLEAVRIGRPYPYLCHCNVVDIAIPIIVEDQYFGAIMAGQIKFSDKTDENKLEKIVHSPFEKFQKNEDIKKMYSDVPKMSHKQLMVITNMLFQLSNYIVEEAISKNIALDLYDRVVTGGGAAVQFSRKKEVEELQSALSNVSAELYMKKESYIGNKVLSPAFEYIYANKGEMVTQTKAAELCHISTGYFSRLFKKEMGEPFSQYFMRLKSEWAKYFLAKTDLSIAQISDKLGFGDPGYFIKIFRKFEGVTPAYYRKTLIK